MKTVYRIIEASFLFCALLWSYVGLSQTYTRHEQVLELEYPDPSSNSYNNIGGELVKMKSGYAATPASGKFVHAYIDPRIASPVSYEPSYIDNDVDNRTINTSAPVGYIPGVHSVSSTGGANYTIPIQLPPGSNEVMPSLAIVYNSQSGNSTLGMGWNISGISSISRVPKTIYHNNKVIGVKLDNTDVFALDGNRLITEGGVYKTESETFSKVTPQSVGTNGPEWFLVETKDGHTIEYGRNNDSRFMSNDGSSVMTWFISKITDSYGNYIQFLYRNQDRECVIEEIAYTGNQNLGISPYNKIEFYYDNSRSDANTQYLDGATIDGNLLLRKIRITSENQHCKNYEFAYSQNLYSFLKEVKEFGANGEELNSTVFKYGNKNNGHDIENCGFDLADNEEALIGDFNGDGHSDILVITDVVTYDGVHVNSNYKLYLRIGQGFTFWDQGNFPTYYSEVEGRRVANHNGYIYSDFDGDGKQDILVADRRLNSQGRKYLHDVLIYSYNGTDFVSQSYTPPSGIGVLSYSPQVIYPGDFDGDGATDFITVLSDGVSHEAYITYPRISPDFRLITNDFGIKLNSSQDIYVIDFDGDGRNELMGVDVYNDQNPRITAIWGFDKVGSYSSSAHEFYAAGYPTKYHEVYTGDFNGDGKTDLLTWSSSVGFQISYSNGKDGFSAVPFSGTLATCTEDGNCKIKIGDYNGDGKSDILFIIGINSTSSSLWIHYSKGTSFETYTATLNVPLDKKMASGDFDGDGKQDEFLRKPINQDENVVYFNKQGKDFLLEKISNGINITTKFEYFTLTEGNGSQFGYSFSTYPMRDRKIPLTVVKNITVPDGIGGSSVTNYTYSGGLNIHLQGKGLLGFNSITSTNYDHKLIETQEFELNSSYYILLLKNKRIGSTSFGTTLANINYTNEVASQGNLRYFHKVVRTVESEPLKGSSITTDYSFDNNNGNLLEALTDVGNGETIRVTNSLFDNNGSWLANKPKLVVTTKTKIGDPIPYTREIRYLYTSEGSVSKETSDQGLDKSIVSNYTYDGYGNIKSNIISAPNDDSHPPDKKMTYQYDNYGRFVTKTINALGHSATAQYDGRWGKPLSETTIDGLTITYQYDGFGDLKQTRNVLGNITTANQIWDINSSSGQLYYTLTHVPGSPDKKVWYDIFEREIKTETEGFSGNIFTNRSYDIRGMLKTVTDVHTPSNGYTPILTSYTYDDYRRLTQITSNSSTQFYTYQTVGNQWNTTETASGTQHFKRTKIDAGGNITQVEDNGGIVDYSYYSSGSLKNTSYDGNNPIKSEDDDYGRQKKLEDINGGITEYEYNAFGDLISQTDAEGNTFTMTYDALGRMISREGPDGITTFLYITQGNGKGQIRKVTGPNNTSTEYQYDNYGRLSSLQETIENHQFTTGYSYDEYGNVKTINYPSGFSITNTYDSKGYLKSVVESSNSSLVFRADESNAFGQLTKYTLGNGVTTDKYYDDYGNLNDEISGIVQHLYYIHNNQTGNLEIRGDVYNDLYETFEYDDINRLTEADGGLTLGPCNVTYENNGNISFKTGIGHYTYDNAKINGVTSIDNLYNAISLETQEVEYTPFDRAESITENGYKVFFTYGPEYDRRKSVLTHQGQVKAVRFYSGNYEIYTDENNDTYEIHYIPGGDGVCAIYVQKNGETGKLYYVYKDHLGSIVKLTNNLGVVVLEQSFDAWGRTRDPHTWEPVSSTDVFGQLPWFNRGYTGHEHLPEFELVNMNNRIYDPIIGRMLAVDNLIQEPYGTQAYNRYSYCYNNPLSYVDPDGENPLIIAAVIIGVAAGGYTGYTIANAKGYDFGDWQTYAYIAGGAVIGGVSGYAGATVSTAGGIMANTVGIMVSSATFSFGMSGLSDGMIDPSISFGVGSYNLATHEWGYLGKKGNKWTQNVGYAFGALANLQDLVTGIWPGDYEFQYEVDKNSSKVGHANLRKGNKIEVDELGNVKPHKVMISVANRNSVSTKHGGLRGAIEYAWKANFKKYTGGPEHWLDVPEKGWPRIPLTLNSKVVDWMYGNLAKNRGLWNIDRTRFGLNFGCVSYAARALWTTGVPTIPIINYFGPKVLWYQLAIRQAGIYASPYVYNGQ